MAHCQLDRLGEGGGGIELRGNWSGEVVFDRLEVRVRLVASSVGGPWAGNCWWLRD